MRRSTPLGCRARRERSTVCSARPSGNMRRGRARQRRTPSATRSRRARRSSRSARGAAAGKTVEVATCGSWSRTTGIGTIKAHRRSMSPCGKEVRRLFEFCAVGLGRALLASSARPPATASLRSTDSAVSASELPEHSNRLAV